ncbi:MAG: hypothetical protein ACHQ1F_02720, partial [Spirochaetia bacterium]
MNNAVLQLSDKGVNDLATAEVLLLPVSIVARKYSASETVPAFVTYRTHPVSRTVTSSWPPSRLEEIRRSISIHPELLALCMSGSIGGGLEPPGDWDAWSCAGEPHSQTFSRWQNKVLTVTLLVY